MVSDHGELTNDNKNENFGAITKEENQQNVCVFTIANVLALLFSDITVSHKRKGIVSV